MAKQAAAEAKPSLAVRTKEFYQEVMTEISKVTWPSQDELKSSTQVVLLMLFLVGALIYVYDNVFQIVVMGILNLV